MKIKTHLLCLLAVTSAVFPAHAQIISADDPVFGEDTITIDTATGIEWLDVTLSTPYTYDEILVETAPGGVFDGYRLATSDEVLVFWQDAGIDTGAGSLGQFTAANFQPIVDLMAFTGVTGLNRGNLGGGNFFDFVAGHIESGPGGGWVSVATLSADPDPTVTGRASFGSVPSDNASDYHGAWLIRATMAVDVDIKPGSDPNAVNVRSRGVVPVAILGSMEFDATLVDFSTVLFGPGEASPVHDGHVGDINGDGFADMVFHFRTRESGITCGDTEATLEGETFTGVSFAGSDSLKTAGCR